MSRFFLLIAFAEAAGGGYCAGNDNICEDGNCRNGRCKCDKHYYEAYCTTYCKSSVTCGGHGQCNTIGECECNDGYWPPDCRASVYTWEPTPVWWMRTLSPTPKPAPQPTPTTTQPSSSPPTSAPPTPATCTAASCSGQGTCQDNGVELVCTCNFDHYGSNCALSAQQWCKEQTSCGKCLQTDACSWESMGDSPSSRCVGGVNASTTPASCPQPPAAATSNPTVVIVVLALCSFVCILAAGCFAKRRAAGVKIAPTGYADLEM